MFCLFVLSPIIHLRVLFFLLGVFLVWVQTGPPLSQKFRLLPLGSDNRMEIPLPSTSSPGACVPRADATNLAGKAQLSAVTSSAEILDWPQLRPKRRKMKRQTLFFPSLASPFSCAGIKNKTQESQSQPCWSRQTVFKMKSLDVNCSPWKLDQWKQSCVLSSRG